MATSRPALISAPGHCCELYQEAEEIGSMLKLTVVYQATGGNKPWNLTQIIMRESKSGVVSVFPAGQTLSGRELLELLLAELVLDS